MGLPATPALRYLFLAVSVLAVADALSPTKTRNNTSNCVGAAISINGDTTFPTIRGEHGNAVNNTVTNTPLTGKSSIHWESFQLQQVADVLPSMAVSSEQGGAPPNPAENSAVVAPSDAEPSAHAREHTAVLLVPAEDDLHIRRRYAGPSAVARALTAADDGLHVPRRYAGPSAVARAPTAADDGLHVPRRYAGPSAVARALTAADDGLHVPRRYAGPSAVARALTAAEDGLHVPRRYAGPSAVARALTAADDGLHVPRRYAGPSAVARALTAAEDGLHVPRPYAGPSAVARALTAADDGLHLPRRYAGPSAVGRALIAAEDGLHVPRRYAGPSAVNRALTSAEDDSRARGTGRPSGLAVCMAGGIVSTCDEEEEGGGDHLHIDSAEEDVAGPPAMLGAHLPPPLVDPIRIMDGMDTRNVEDTLDRIRLWAAATVASSAYCAYGTINRSRRP